MKKNILAIIFFLLALSFSYSEGIPFKQVNQNLIPKGKYQSIIGNTHTIRNTQKTGSRKSHSSIHFLTPIIGYDSFIIANTCSLGLDYMYLRQNGFAFYFNNALLLGTSKNKEYYRDFDGKTSVSEEKMFAVAYAFELLFGYSRKIASHRIGFGLGFQGAYGTILEFGAFAMRIDYSYFFKDSIGINVSLTDALGITVPIVGEPSVNRFSIKVGTSFKL